MREMPPFLMEVTRTLNVPREKVFAAFTDPEWVRAWWAPKGWYTPHVEIDARVGGRYRLGMRSDNDPSLMYVHGEYLVVQPPERLVFTYIWEAGGAGDRWLDFDLVGIKTVVTVKFRDAGGKTELVIQHEGFPTKDGCDQHRLGWSSNTDCLEEFLAGILKHHART
jgi:uncharacterized protein YndB with AHSA1/START domain